MHLALYCKINVCGIRLHGFTIDSHNYLRLFFVYRYVILLFVMVEMDCKYLSPWCAYAARVTIVISCVCVCVCVSVCQSSTILTLSMHAQ